MRRGGEGAQWRGEADAFPPQCCRRLLPLARAWTPASLPNHLLSFPHPGPLSGDPLPPPPCPGQSSTAVSRMVVWAWAGCTHSPDSCPAPASLGLPLGITFPQLPSSKVLGGCPQSSSPPCLAPSPSAGAHPLLPGGPAHCPSEPSSGHRGSEVWARCLALPPLVACWGFRHLGLVTRQPRREGWLWLGLAQAAAAGEAAARPAEARVTVVGRGWGLALQLRTPCHSRGFDLGPAPGKGPPGHPGPCTPGSEPSGFREVGGSRVGAERRASLFRDRGVALTLLTTPLWPNVGDTGVRSPGLRVAVWPWMCCCLSAPQFPPLENGTTLAPSHEAARSVEDAQSSAQPLRTCWVSSPEPLVSHIGGGQMLQMLTRWPPSIAG